MDCPICLEDPETPITLSCCSNIYCSKCIHQWNQVRNTCPLCCNVMGGKEHNTLKNYGSNEFDDGFLMLETQIKQILDKIKHLKVRIENKKDQSKNLKSAVSFSLISYLQESDQKLNLFKNCMEEQILLRNRPNVVEYMQLLTQLIINLQSCLDNNSVVVDYDQEDEDYDYDYDYVEDYRDQYDDYDEYQMNIEKKFSKAKKTKFGSNSFQEQKAKSGKLI